MRHRAYLLVCAGVLLAVWAAIGLFRTEPAYSGRKVSAWLGDLDATNRWVREGAEVAIVQLGSNAVPAITRLIRKRDPQFKKWLRDTVGLPFEIIPASDSHDRAVLAVRALGADARDTIPAWRSLLSSGHSPAAAAVGLYCVGPEGVPVLIEALSNHNPQVRAEAAAVLGLIGRPAEPAVHALVSNLNDPDGRVRTWAARALGEIGAQPALVVPALTASLQSTNVEVRLQAVRALARFGTNAAPATVAVTELRLDTDDKVRRAVTNALEDIEQGRSQDADLDGRPQRAVAHRNQPLTTKR